ncbi:farnesyl pyrophosphate synthase-like [Haliotis rubra]|uniref:farnesyl pyrophosphate synthase-like n=1 Tax=Haliotis rubra TaxID=36100 RepID=UPI001EE54C6F|nr:farnesyl pyrophosphate synthase-like [Haliotis rubra]XP_046574695.1 farnesyl pyrophosphate synthase-like [Haliotis rubra]XP_046574696.1 farnesyl pyrophosphate synthase-like [Haliotis rubra]
MGDDQCIASKKSRSMSELEEFDSIFPDLVDGLTKIGLKDAEISDAMKWFKEVSEYNVPFGKKNRGMSVAMSYQSFVPDASQEDLKRARILGWCVEWLQAFFLVADDLMDKSVTRRGKPCWYKRENVGTIAVNDSFYLEAALYQILKKHFRHLPYYTSILELFHDTTMQTVIGQCLDLTTAPPEGTVDFKGYTLDRYSAIVKYKTAFYSFYLPVALAMYMAGISDEASHANAKTILLQMGHFFQVQDDFLDCYGDPEVIGKIGTDIEDNKCGWLVVQALNRANDSQRKLLEENYGQHDPEKVKKVKEVFRELNLQKVYTDYEESSYNDLSVLIGKCAGNLPEEVFRDFAKKIYKRQK